MKQTSKPGWTIISISAHSRRLVERLVGCEVSDAVLRSDGRYDVQIEDELLANLLSIDSDIDRAIECACHLKH